MSMRIFDFKERKIITTGKANLIISDIDVPKMLDMKLKEFGIEVEKLTNFFKEELKKYDSTEPVIFYMNAKNVTEAELGALRFTISNAIINNIVLTSEQREEEIMGVGLFPDLQYATIPYATLVDLVNKKLNIYTFDIVFNLEDQEIGLEGDVALWQF